MSKEKNCNQCKKYWNEKAIRIAKENEESDGMNHYFINITLNNETNGCYLIETENIKDIELCSSFFEEGCDDEYIDKYYGCDDEIVNIENAIEKTIKNNGIEYGNYSIKVNGKEYEYSIED